jgi:cell fate (sporulation/competence/biofilm development) regulator YmcA (YheA/YmcA/DUF963 family)
MIKKYGLKLTQYNGINRYSGVKKVIIWRGYTFEQFCKWQWYFKYRESLLRVENPRYIIDWHQFTEEVEDRYLTIKKSIDSNKSLLSRYENRLARYIQNFKATQKNAPLFIELDGYEKQEDYKKAIETINKIKVRIDKLERLLHG